MSFDYWSSGVFGVLLSDLDPSLEPLIAEMRVSVANWNQMDIESDEDDEELPVDEDFDESDQNGEVAKILQGYLPAVIEKLAALGVKVPQGVELFYTKDEDDRFTRCSTPCDDFVIGFSMFTSPWEYPDPKDWDESFKQKAQFWSWVEGG